MIRYLEERGGVRYFYVPLAENGEAAVWFSTVDGELCDPNLGLQNEFKEILKSYGGPVQNIARMRQVHGNTVLTVNEDRQEGGVIGEADGLITNLSGTPLQANVADCLSIQMYDPSSGALANLHCGWRSGAKNIITLALTKLIKQYGFEPENSTVSLMPSICKERYQVGDDVYSAYTDNIDGMEPFFDEDDEGKWLFDIRGMAKEILRRGGIKTGNIIDLDDCTYDKADLYYSYRRDGAGTGRMVAILCKMCD